jgi:hypothetical protein
MNGFTAIHSTVIVTTAQAVGIMTPDRLDLVVVIQKNQSAASS